MDRAAKVKKYRKEMTNHNQYSRQQWKVPGTSLPAQGLLFIGLSGVILLVLLFVLLHKKEEESDLTYVTQQEFASLMSFLGEDALPEQSDKDMDLAITQGQLKDLIQAIGLAGTISIKGGTELLDRKTMMDYYTQILDYMDLGETVLKKTILLLDQDGSICQTQDGEIKLNVDSIKLNPFYTYDVFLADGKLLGICAKSNKTIALKNVTVGSVTDKTITFTYQKQEYQIACADTDGLQEGAKCTLCIKDGKITKIKDFSDKSGSSGQENEKKPEKKYGETVKVLLLNKDAIHYEQIYITCSTDCSVIKEAKKKTCKKSDVIDIKKMKLKKGSSIQVTPAKSSAQLFLADAKGNRISNGYYGSFYIYRDADGYYIVNKVNIEKYLYSVVASEMPSSFGKEALKAQAVCARSYVYRQMAAGDYQDYHAQIDDSTNYQVYNKSQASDEDVQAVNETAGQVMYAQDQIVNAYYYSASCGYGSGMEIWNQDQGAYPYLKAKSLNPSGSDKNFDLSDEKNFRVFITSGHEKSYDSSSLYFRWKARVELSTRQKEIRKLIEQRNKVSPQNFAFYQTSGKKQKKVSSMKGFGGIKKMYCKKRSKSGAILVLTIAFEFGKVEIKSEYNIRSVVGCALEQLTYADGSKNTASRFLPSAYFSISYEKKSGRYVLSGGGNGHGIGMSQYGASGMAKKGWDYKKILEFYYDGITVKKTG